MNNLLYQDRLVPDLIVDALSRNDEYPCLYLGSEMATYREVRHKVSQYAQALQQKNIKAGTRVALLSGNCPDVVFFNLAASIVGCCVTPLHPLGSFDDQAYILNDAEIEVLVFQPSNYEQRASELLTVSSNLKHFLAFGPTEVGVDYTALAGKFDPAPLVTSDVQSKDISNIVYTGGTTGKPKGVMLTYTSLVYMTMMQMAEWDIPSRVRFMVVTPLSHAGFTCMVPTLLRGGCLYVPPSFSPDVFFDMVEQHRINATMLVPVMLYALLDSERAAFADMSSMVCIFYGASPISSARLREAIEKWGKIFAQFYGQTEAPTCFANLRREEHDLDAPGRLESCGRPSAWISVALLDEDCKEVERGSAGEICVRGPLLMQRYLNKPEQTQKAFEGGWLHTGDLGRFDKDGFLYIVGRKKDLIITGGFNVFPREVEDVLSAHADVEQAVVFGLPDERWGEAVNAVVVLRSGVKQSDELSDSLIDLVKTAKGSVQAPKAIYFIKSIPLTPIGKPDKQQIISMYQA